MVRIFINFTLPKYTHTSNDQVKEEKMERAYSKEIHTGFWRKNQEERDQ
jgi:hypothetical protein